MKLFGTMKINDSNHLEIGGCDSIALIKKFGSPLYVIDEEQLRERCKFFKRSFSAGTFETEVIYASKAFLTKAMCRLIREEGLSLDVVSGGELFTALEASFPAEKIYMHGNNKTIDELKMALETGVGRIVVDNSWELGLIEGLAENMEQASKKVKVLLRVNPGIEAHTHEYIKTTKNDSKFGESIFLDKVQKMLENIKKSQFVEFKGFHSHIGSQIFEESSFLKQATLMLEYVKKIELETEMKTEELNLGGGFGTYYADGDKPMDLERYFNSLITHVGMEINRLNLKAMKLMIEPGRSIIANCGVTLYTVGSTKQTVEGRQYLFVDGGMTDNPRPALYQAVYEGALGNRMREKPVELYTVAGKCCESGDVLIKDLKLPKAESGDILAVGGTGAYNYSMSSNYNRVPRPGVVFVKNGDSACVVKRETYEDLLRNDL